MEVQREEMLIYRIGCCINRTKLLLVKIVAEAINQLINQQNINWQLVDSHVQHTGFLQRLVGFSAFLPFNATVN